MWLFDLETTGLSVEENCIIEFGALKCARWRGGRLSYDLVKPGGGNHR